MFESSCLMHMMLATLRQLHKLSTCLHTSDQSRSVIVSAARSLTCRDDLDSKWRLLLAENELSCVSLLSSISIGN